MPTNLLPIEAIAAKLDLPDSLYEKRSPISAKLSLDLLDDGQPNRNGKLILVTATTPTASGEGKTVTSIGLVQGLERIGKRALITSREPSLGPRLWHEGRPPAVANPRSSPPRRSTSTSTATSTPSPRRTTCSPPSSTPTSSTATISISTPTPSPGRAPST